jgi:Spy/CpxP family protein refolding chaperone
MAVLTLLRSRSESRIYQLLTPEQRKQASEQREQFGPHPASLRGVKHVSHMQHAM